MLQPFVIAFENEKGKTMTLSSPDDEPSSWDHQSWAEEILAMLLAKRQLPKNIQNVRIVSLSEIL